MIYGVLREFKNDLWTIYRKDRIQQDLERFLWDLGRFREDVDSIEEKFRKIQGGFWTELVRIM